MKILTAIQCAYYWDKVLSNASKGNDDIAQQYLDKISSYLEGDTTRMYTETHILRGHLHSKAGEYSHAVKNGKTALQLIYKSEKYSVCEKNYLTAYVASFCIPAFVKVGKNDEAILYDKFLDYDIIELGKVRTSLKRNFPLSSHPKWNSVVVR